MKKLKDILNESYAWERKPGKPLPTLSEVQAEYEKNLQEETEYKVAGRPVKLNKNGTEDQTKWTVTFANGKTEQYSSVMSLIKPRPKLQEPRWQDNDGDGKWYEKGDDVKAEGVNEAGKFHRGSRHNDEPFDFKDDKPSRPKMQTPKEWDDLMDLVNNDPRFETYTGEDGYQIKDTKGGRSNLIWQLTPGRYSWNGIGRSEAGHPRQFNDVKELIKNFYERTGLSNPDNSDVNLGENMRRFGTKNLNEANVATVAPQIAKNNSCWDAKKYPILAKYIGKRNIDVMGLIKVAITIIITGLNPIDALIKQYTFFKQMNPMEMKGIVNELKSFVSCISKNYSSLIF